VCFINFDDLSYISTACNSTANTKEITNSKINIYPNPFQEKIEIQFDENILNIELFDLMSKKLPIEINYGQQNIEVHTNALKNGTYLLKIHTQKGIVLQKMIKN
jgi:hypothetical protein